MSPTTWIEQIRNAQSDSPLPAFHDTAGAVTGRELIGKAVCAGDLLVALDVKPGVGIPALMTTNSCSLAMLLGGAAADRPLAPLGPRLSTDELADIVTAIGSPVLLTEDAFASTAAAVAHRTGVRAVTIPSLDRSATALPAAVAADQVAFILHTAGTTGAAKRVAITDAVLLQRARVLADLIGFGPSTTFATGSPFHHLGGVGNLLAALTAGGAAVATSQFSLEWWAGLCRTGVTHALLVPTMIEMLLNSGILDSISLTTLIYGAAAIRPETLRRVIDRMPNTNLVNLFGQTEGSPITCLDADDHRRALSRPELLESVGRAVPGLRLRIDPTVGGDAGEVLAAARHLSVTDSDGWLHTGDVGVLDGDGYLRLRGRHHDMIVRGGENVYPIEVENVIGAFSKVKTVGVVGVPDPRLGETIAAFVIATDAENPPTAAELHAWSRARLAGYKVPAYWYVVDDLPLNAAGKLRRQQLVRQHLEQH